MTNFFRNNNSISWFDNLPANSTKQQSVKD
jgi:hypothetical protein